MAASSSAVSMLPISPACQISSTFSKNTFSRGCIDPCVSESNPMRFIKTFFNAPLKVNKGKFVGIKPKIKAIMISIVAKFSVNEGQEDNFLRLVNELGIASRAENGCIEYILHKDVQKPLTYCIIEKWKDKAAIDSHNNSAHFTSTVPKIVTIAKAEIDVYHPVL